MKITALTLAALLTGCLLDHPRERRPGRAIVIDPGNPAQCRPAFDSTGAEFTKCTFGDSTPDPQPPKP